MPNFSEKLPPRLVKSFPAIAFFGGFIWDSVTIGKAVQTLDLWILSAYWLFSALLMGILQRKWSPAWEERFTWGLQFLFGSLFSALVIVYFKSSGSFYTLLVVIGLVIFLVANEFLQSKYVKDSLTWGIFALSGAMLLNFIVPHWLHGVGFWYFFLGLLLSTIPVLALWIFSPKPRQALIVPGGVLLLLLLGHALDLIPPVPLVLKQSLVCKNFEQGQGQYTCLEPDQGLTTRLGLSPFQIHHKAGESIHVLNSIFAPNQVDAQLEHRWWYYDEKENHWKASGVVPFHMKGGRQNGWRVQSLKRQMLAGSWKVETAVAGGAVVGYVEFEVPPEDEASGQSYTRKKLD